MAEYTKEELLRKQEEARDTLRIRRQKLAEAQKAEEEEKTALIDAQNNLRKWDLLLDKRR